MATATAANPAAILDPTPGVTRLTGVTMSEGFSCINVLYPNYIDLYGGGRVIAKKRWGLDPPRWGLDPPFVSLKPLALTGLSVY